MTGPVPMISPRLNNLLQMDQRVILGLLRRIAKKYRVAAPRAKWAGTAAFELHQALVDGGMTYDVALCVLSVECGGYGVVVIDP